MQTIKNKIIIPLIIFMLFGAVFFLPAQTTVTVESVLFQVSDLLSDFRYNEAIALFDTIPQDIRDNTSFLLLRASILNSAGRYSEAFSIADAINRAEPGNIEAMFVLSAIEGAQGRADRQQALLEGILRIDPNNVDASIELGKLHLRNRSLRNAATNFHRVFSIYPDNFDALIGLGQYFRLSRDYEEAELFLNRAVELYPQSAEARVERARLYRNGSFLINALDDLDLAAELAPNNYWVAIDRGTLLLEMNRRRQALEEFERAIQINPGESQAYIYTSALKDEFGDFDGAMEDYAIVSVLRPDYFYAFEGLGIHLMRHERWEEARDAFMEAYRRAPDDHFFALLAAISWIRVDRAGPRQFIAQVNTRVERESLAWFMFRLFYDLTAMSHAGETDMAARLDRETNPVLKARMLFYMAQYYEIRNAVNLANRYYLMVYEMDTRVRAIPEWRYIEWVLRSRNLIPN